MYLYRNTAKNAFHWGHISSSDLLHWRHHPDALTGECGDEGCFSGGAFLDDDGTCYLTFWKFPAKDKLPSDPGGIALAKSLPPYDIWERIEPLALEHTEWGICDLEKDGQLLHLGCADPSNIWKNGDTYYMETGNLCVLNQYGRAEDSLPAYRGDWTELLKSKDLVHWEYVHRFYENPHTDSTYPDATEDDMCPEFLPLPDAPSGGSLTDSYLQLFIAHNRGAQYYIGKYHDEHFYPEQHGRFSWVDSACFAPESMIDAKNRQLAWYWFRDNPRDPFHSYGWNGVYSFPRMLWLEDGILHMRPADELSSLQTHEIVLDSMKIDDRKEIPVHNGASFRLTADIEVGTAEKIGFTVRDDGMEKTRIYYDLAVHALVMDTTESGCDGWKVKECAPFALSEGEILHLDIMVDHSTIEVYSNERQAIARRVYPTHPENAIRIHTLAEGGVYQLLSAKIWDIEPTNPY